MNAETLTKAKQELDTILAQAAETEREHKEALAKLNLEWNAKGAELAEKIKQAREALRKATAEFVGDAYRQPSATSAGDGKRGRPPSPETAQNVEWVKANPQATTREIAEKFAISAQAARTYRQKAQAQAS